MIGIQVKIAVSKKDGNNNWNNNLIGAQFTLYEGATNLGSITIQNQNAHQFDADVWPGHTYTIKEHIHLPGYNRSRHKRYNINNSLSVCILL